MTVGRSYLICLVRTYTKQKHHFPIPPLPKLKLDWLSEWTESQSCLSHKMAVSHSNITPESGSTYVLFNMTSSYLTIIYQRNNLPNFQTWSANVVGEIGCRYRLLLKFAKWELLVQNYLRSWANNSNDEIKLISTAHDLLGVVFPHYIFLQINTWLWRHFWSAGGLQSAGLRFAATVIIVNANSSTKSLWMIHWYSSNILKSNLSSIYSSFSFISFSSVNGVDCEM